VFRGRRRPRRAPADPSYAPVDNKLGMRGPRQDAFGLPNARAPGPAPESAAVPVRTVHPAS